jgi:hypothetical protein
MAETIDFSLEGSSKAALAKALVAMGNQLGYDLIDENNVPNPGLTIVVNVPAGSTTAGIPEGYHFRGPFVHRPGVYDENGLELEAPILSPNWVLDIRLSDIPGLMDRETGIDEVEKSKLKTWIKNTGAVLVRAGANTDHPGNISYYQKDLTSGDWLRLYYNVSFPKHEFFGGRSL